MKLIDMQEIASQVAIVPGLIANAYLVGDRRAWVLVDSATPSSEPKILRAAEARFGRGARPAAILLDARPFRPCRLARRGWPNAGARRYSRTRWSCPASNRAGHYPAARHLEARVFLLAGALLSVQHGRSWRARPGLCRAPSRAGRHSKLPDTLPGTCVSIGRPMVCCWPATRSPPWTWTASGARSRNGRRSAARPCRRPWTGGRRANRCGAWPALRPSLIAAGHGAPLRGAADQLQRLAGDFRIP